MHTAHSSTFMSPEMFARSIELYTECCFSHLYSHDCLPGVPGVSAGIFQNITLKTLPSLEIVMPTIGSIEMPNVMVVH